MPNIYAQDLPKNDANFAALTPLLYLERSALVYPDPRGHHPRRPAQTWAQTARCRQLAKEGSKLVYRCAKQRSEPAGDKRGAKAVSCASHPLELIDRIAALVPPPRTHRHRYFGVLAPNSPLRAAVTALAQPAASQPATVETAQPGAGVPGVAAPGNAATPTPEPEARPKRAAHYLWAVLIARIYEAFPLLCPMCGGQMRIIAFITHSAEIRHILNHIGVVAPPAHHPGTRATAVGGLRRAGG